MEVDAATEVVYGTDKRTPVGSASLQRKVSPLATLKILDENNRSQGAIDACAETPWFHVDAVDAVHVRE